MRIIDLLTSLLINLPVLDLAALGSHQNVVFVNLEKLRRLVAKLELLYIVFSSGLQIDNGNIDDALLVNGEAENSSGVLDDGVVPLDLEHLIPL